jgi:SAM-dependent methyltransferase
MGKDDDLPPGVRYHLLHRRGEPSFRSQAEAALRRLPPGGGRVLDLGCGTGALAPDLAAAGRRWCGADRDEGMLEGARRRIGGAAARLVRAEAHRLPYRAGAFDAVVSLGLFEYLPDPAAVLAEVRRVLGPGGVAVIAFPRRGSFYRRCQALVAPLLRLAGREDPFDLRSARAVEPEALGGWADAAGLRLLAVERVAPAVLPWPADRALPGLARWLADRAGPGWGIAWLVVLGDADGG